MWDSSAILLQEEEGISGELYIFNLCLSLVPRDPGPRHQKLQEVELTFW